MSGADNNTTPTRKRNNAMLGLVLAAFVTLVFAVTIAKMMAGHNMEATDHVLRPALETSE